MIKGDKGTPSNFFLSMCMACTKRDAVKAMELYWNMPLEKLWALFHTSLHLQGLKVRYSHHQSSKQKSYREIFKMFKDDAQHTNKHNQAGEDFAEVDYVR